jgi:hypothetical protein
LRGVSALISSISPPLDIEISPPFAGGGCTLVIVQDRSDSTRQIAVSETHEHNTSGGNVSRHDDDQPKRGRPSDYSFQVAISICARLAEGKSLRAICSEAGMPGRATVFRWIACHKEFREEYILVIRAQPRVGISCTKPSELPLGGCRQRGPAFRARGRREWNRKQPM